MTDNSVDKHVGLVVLQPNLNYTYLHKKMCVGGANGSTMAMNLNLLLLVSKYTNKNRYAKKLIND